MPGLAATPSAEDESELDFYKGSLEDLGKIRDEEVPDGSRWFQMVPVQSVGAALFPNNTLQCGQRSGDTGRYL